MFNKFYDIDKTIDRRKLLINFLKAFNKLFTLKKVQSNKHIQQNNLTFDKFKKLFLFYLHKSFEA